MRIDQLRYFLRIIEIGSFRQAAEELHVSQPALSASLKGLERELGAQLMERGRSGVRLTSVGNEVLSHIRSIVESEMIIRSEVDAHRGLRRGMIRIGSANAGNILLPSVLRSFHDRYPGVQLQVTEAGSLDIEHQVNDGEFDIGLVVTRKGRGVNDALMAQTLLSGPLVACVPSDHPFTDKRSVTADDIAEQPLILLPQGYFMHSLAFELLEGRQLNVVFYSDNSASVKRMIASGVGITILPEFSVHTEALIQGGGIARVPLRSDFQTIRLEMVRRRRSYASHAIREFWTAVVDQASAVQNAREHDRV